MPEPSTRLPAAGADRATLRKAIADRLYDDLTGRHTAAETGRTSGTAVLAHVEFDDTTERGREIHELHRHADSLGLVIHYAPGDRWNLAQRLAENVLDVLATSTQDTEQGGGQGAGGDVVPQPRVVRRSRNEFGLPIAEGLVVVDPRQAPPTASYAGSNSDRQSVGLPGHCEACAQHGHITAHPDFGCGDVGCTSRH